jgi:hypothetical protein
MAPHKRSKGAFEIDFLDVCKEFIQQRVQGHRPNVEETQNILKQTKWVLRENPLWKPDSPSPPSAEDLCLSEWTVEGMSQEVFKDGYEDFIENAQPVDPLVFFDPPGSYGPGEYNGCYDIGRHLNKYYEEGKVSLNVVGPLENAFTPGHNRQRADLRKDREGMESLGRFYWFWAILFGTVIALNLLS